MDSPFTPKDLEPIPGRRGPLPPAWVPIAIIAAVLGLAAWGAAQVTDTRDFSARHSTVLTRTAL
jgi:hypothetical protein